MVQEFASIWLFLQLRISFSFSLPLLRFLHSLKRNLAVAHKKCPPPQQQQLTLPAHLAKNVFGKGRGGGSKRRRKGHVLEMSPLIEALFSTIQEKGGGGKEIFSVAAATRKQPTECMRFPEKKLLKFTKPSYQGCGINTV